jgi:hypothetical protein
MLRTDNSKLRKLRARDPNLRIRATERADLTVSLAL